LWTLLAIVHAASSMWNGILWLLHTILALGTTPACKSLFPEEVYLPIGFKADLSIFGHTL
jgi:hypothetical protein